MSFTPLSEGVSTALSDISEPLFSRRIHLAPDNNSPGLAFTIKIIVISAILFITVIALYDVVRSAITIYFADKALTDPLSGNTPQQIRQTKISNENTFYSSVIFALICIITAPILIILILMY